MASQTNRVDNEDFLFGQWEGPDAGAGAVCALTNNTAGVAKFSSILGAGALPAGKAPFFILNGKSTTGGTATAGDTVRVQPRGLVRGITYPGLAPTPGLDTLVYYGDGGGLELVPAALGTWPLGYVVSVNGGAGTYDAWFDGAAPWGAAAAALGVDGATLDLTGGGLAEIKAGGVGSTQLGPGGMRCMGQAAAVVVTLPMQNVGDAFSLTFDGATHIFELTNGGAPGGGHIGVDIPTLPGSMTAALTGVEPRLSASYDSALWYFYVSDATAVKAAKTLTAASVAGFVLLSQLVTATAEAKRGIEVFQYTFDSLTATNGKARFFTTGTFVSWILRWRALGSTVWTYAAGADVVPQAATVEAGKGLSVVYGAGAAGDVMEVWALVQY